MKAKTNCYFFIPSIVIIATTTLLLFVKPASAQSWEQVGNTGFSQSETRYLSLAIDKNGTPYLAYQNLDNYKATVKKFDGTNWVNVGTSDVSDGEATGLSLTFDQNNIPYLSYTSGANGEDSYLITVKKFNGTQWVTVGSPLDIGVGVETTSLAIKKDGTVYVAFQDSYNYSAALVKKFNGTKWVAVGGVISPSSAEGLSLAINEKDGFPYVAYSDRYYSYKATVKKFNGTSWVSVGPIGFTSTGTSYISLAIDKNGNPYLAYQDDNSGKANVRKFDGTSWTWVGDPDFTMGASYESLVLDQNGTPLLAYKDWNTDYGKASINRFNGTGWAFVGSAGFTPVIVENISLAIDTTSGTVFLAYQEVENNNYTSVMKFPLSAMAVNLEGFSAKAVANTAVLSWSTVSEQKGDKYEIQRSTDGAVFKSIGYVNGNENTKTTNTYSFTDNAPIQNAINYYRLNQIDNNGRSNLSKIIPLHFEAGTNKINLYPNPASDFIRLKCDVNEQKLIVNIYDISGKSYWNKTYLNPANFIQIDIKHLPAGTYQLIAADERGNKSSGFFIRQ